MKREDVSKELKATKHSDSWIDEKGNFNKRPRTKCKREMFKISI